MDERARARERAEELLQRRWAPARFRLQVRREQVRRHRGLGRPLYEVQFGVWERAGQARVEGDGRVRFPLPWDAPMVGVDPAALPPETLAVVTEVAQRVHPDEPVRVVARGALDPSCFGVERLPGDGRLTVQIDPSDGELLGYTCLPFFRGSRRCAALSRWGAVQRATAQVALPEGARLAYSKLSSRPLGRLWGFRWEVGRGPLRGWVKVELNARTGVVCRLLRAVDRVSLVKGERGDEATARSALELAARVRHGASAELGPLVPGAVVRRGKPCQAWLAVIQTPRGSVRASLVEGRVALEPPRRAG
jgi:hypothetical protein